MKKIVVNCEYNDPVDIKCGGARILGFDFYVDNGEVDAVKKYIKEKLRERELPLMDIFVEDAPDNAKRWSFEQISLCIDEGY